MSNYPNAYDDDTTLQPINDNIDQIGGEAINDLRDAVLNIEMALGLNIAGTVPTLADRLGVFINPDGTPNASVIYGLGLVTLPITNIQIAEAAGIDESKLLLDYPTANLFNYIRDLSKDVNLAISWQATVGIKLEPHLLGLIYRHDLAQIDVAEVSAQFLNNVFRVNRNNATAYLLINDMNNELLAHQWADGSTFGSGEDIVTNNGSTYPSFFAHVASGIFLDTAGFAIIPQTANSVQAFANFFDTSSILSLGTRIQNLYANGISRNSQSSSLINDGYGATLVPVTPAIAYLLGATGNNSFPTDDIAVGDDIIQLVPSPDDGYVFEDQFALVNPGDIITINYAADGYNVKVSFVISEKKYIQGSTSANSIFIIRILGKNIAYSPNATATITKSLFNNNKYGVLSVAGVNSPTNQTPSLIVTAPRGAECTGIGFTADQFNETHYLFYLVLYPNGNPLNGSIALPGIDMTGNQGTTPGSYTLDSIVTATNNAFRQPGYNYRFVAFESDGEFGIMLADSYNNASFSVISALVTANGAYDQANTLINYPNNVVDVFPVTGTVAPDPLGFGPNNAGLASPPFASSFGSAAAALLPTILFTPLRRNNYYVNGAERETLNSDIMQTEDSFGDGYWLATIDGYTSNPGPPGHVSVTYLINLNLAASGLKVGKTLVVQPVPGMAGIGNINYGRFIIDNVTFVACPNIQTQITVYDAVYAQGVSPYPIAPVGSQVAIYFDNDSVSFNAETATDFVPISTAFKRFFEVYIDANGNTHTHERGRFSISGATTVNGIPLYNSNPSLGQMDLVTISPKLNGNQNSSVNKITLSVFNFDPVGGLYDGYLAFYNGTSFTNTGPLTTGKIGETVRFYDQTNIDYIDIIFGLNNTYSAFINQYVDIQLFPSLQLDEDIMVIASCQERTDTQSVSRFTDLRQFGNTSEEQFTTSALNYIALPERLLHFNGVVRGFDATVGGNYGTDALLALSGGLALVNGNFESINEQIFTIPCVQEVYLTATYPVNYALCVNDEGELVTIVLTDYDAINGTPNVTPRIVTVNNVVSNTTYQVDSAAFSYILNDRKDLTPLYIVTAVVTGLGLVATTAITGLRDVRRYNNDADSSIPAVLTNDQSRGNFRTLSAALNWLIFNSEYQNNLQIKGTNLLSSDPGLNFPLIIQGGGTGASLTFSTTISVSEVTFENLTLVFNGVVTATNITFTNCNIIFNSTATLTGCTVDPSTVVVNGLITTSQTSFLNSTFTIATIIPAFVLGSGTIFEGNTFNYSVNPIGDGYYRTSDLVNSGSGMIYANILATLSDISITNNIFNNTLADHYSFISIQVSNRLAVLQNIDISNNQFVSSSATTFDIRAVIAITSTITGFTDFLPFWPSAISVSIDDNICNADQMILFSTDRVPGQPLAGSMLNAINCHISGNVCGTIGFITAQNITAVSSLGSFGTDKAGQLTISNNSCKFITNLDSLGYYIPFYIPGAITPTVTVTQGTGAYSITNNYVSWIQVGCASPGTSPAGALITGNRLAPSNPTYLFPYTDPTSIGWLPDNAGIVLRGENATAGFGGGTGFCNSIISDNTFSTQTIWNVSGTSYTYSSAIACFGNALISNNTICGVVNSQFIPGSGIIYLWGTNSVSLNTPAIKVIGNSLKRNGNGFDTIITGYVIGTAGATNQVSIVENTFDSTTVDGTNTQTGYNIPSFWEFRNNYNQTFYVEFSLADQAIMTIADGPTGAPSFDGPARPQGVIQIVSTSASDSTPLPVWFSRFLNNGGIDSQYALVFDNQESSIKRISFAKTFGLDTLIPPNCRLTNISMGVCLFDNDSIGTQALDWSSPGSGNVTYNCVTLTFMSYTSLQPGVLPNILDVFTNAPGTDHTFQFSTQASYTVHDSGTEQAIRLATQYLTPAGISTGNFVTGQNYRFAVSVDLNYLKLTTTNAITWGFSPIVATCIYGA